MSKPVHPIALFRLSILGPLTSRIDINHGEAKKIIKQLASQTYHIPNSRRVHISEKTIQRWYYLWKKGGIDALAPKTRNDKHSCLLKPEVQSKLLSLKKEKPSRSIPTIISIIEHDGLVVKNSLSHSTAHRLLRKAGLSTRTTAPSESIERRAFEAVNAGDIWYGDVMHGPTIQTKNGAVKSFLVSIIDDASRLVCHTCFCEHEDAVAIERVLKDALLKRGLPHKLIVDNGPAYRSGTLQSICARLGIRLIYGKPYEPQSKGKLERWHRTVRDKFLAECELENINSLEAFNARLWVWIETIYHATPHQGLSDKQTPLERYQKDLSRVQGLGQIAQDIDDIFYHRTQRTVKKDGTVSLNGQLYEVPYHLVGAKVILVIDPHNKIPHGVESLSNDKLGKAVPLDKTANLTRTRNRPKLATEPSCKATSFVESVFDAAKETLDITHEE